MINKKLLIKKALLWTPLVFLSCNQKTSLEVQSKTTEFWDSNNVKVQNSNFVLSKAQKLGVPYQVKKITKTFYDPEIGGAIPQDDFEISFPNLTEQNCQKLIEAFTFRGQGDYGNVPYTYCTAGLTYKIEHFLPRIVEATKGIAFRGEYKNGRSTATNCWGTAWEFARLDYQGMFVNFTTDKDWLAGFRAQKPQQLGRKISLSGNPSWNEIRNQLPNNLQTGDLFLIVANTNFGELLMHVGVYIDENLVFQKFAGPSVFTFQLNTFDSGLQAYGKGNSLWFYRPVNKFPNPDKAIKQTCQTIASTMQQDCPAAVYYNFQRDDNNHFYVPLNVKAL